MKRSKPPVLTSPWKMGFFVSLMLVFVGVGVTYFFMRTYDISWQWRDLERWTAVTRGEGILIEIFPLIVTIGLSSIVSYLLIAQAVREYRHYLDSGHDYRNLITSLRDIDDVQDKSQIDKIKNHPELRSFLLRVREAFIQEQQNLEKREKALANSVKGAEQAKHRELNRKFSDACSTLAAAVQNGSISTLESLDIPIPELDRVAKAVRAALARLDDVSGGPADIEELRTAGELAQSRVKDIAKDFQDSCRSARDIERSISNMGQSDSADDVNWSFVESELARLADSVDGIDRLSTSLEALGEEARGVAINAAMKAGSGQGTHADVVQFADELKSVAARFSDLSKSYRNLTAGLKQTVMSPQSHFGRWADVMKSGSKPSQGLGNVMDKLSSWVEHVTELTNKVRDLETSFQLSMGALSKSSEPVESQGSQTIDHSEFEMLGERVPIFSEPENPPSAGEIEKNQDDMLGAESMDSELFVDLANERPVTLEPDDAELGESHDGFEDLPSTRPLEPTRASVEIEDVALQRGSAPATVAEATPEEIFEDPVDDAIDLYALGAIDYDPALHN